jgi:hypothetical protein
VCKRWQREASNPWLWRRSQLTIHIDHRHVKGVTPPERSLPGIVRVATGCIRKLAGIEELEIDDSCDFQITGKSRINIAIAARLQFSAEQWALEFAAALRSHEFANLRNLTIAEGMLTSALCGAVRSSKTLSILSIVGGISTVCTSLRKGELLFKDGELQPASYDSYVRVYGALERFEHDNYPVYRSYIEMLKQSQSLTSLDVLGSPSMLLVTATLTSLQSSRIRSFTLANRLCVKLSAKLSQILVKSVSRNRTIEAVTVRHNVGQAHNEWRIEELYSTECLLLGLVERAKQDPGSDDGSAGDTRKLNRLLIYNNSRDCTKDTIFHDAVTCAVASSGSELLSLRAKLDDDQTKENGKLIAAIAGLTRINSLTLDMPMWEHAMLHNPDNCECGPRNGFSDLDDDTSDDDGRDHGYQSKKHMEWHKQWERLQAEPFHHNGLDGLLPSLSQLSRRSLVDITLKIHSIIPLFDIVAEIITALTQPGSLMRKISIMEIPLERHENRCSESNDHVDMSRDTWRGCVDKSDLVDPRVLGDSCCSYCQVWRERANSSMIDVFTSTTMDAMTRFPELVIRVRFNTRCHFFDCSYDRLYQPLLALPLGRLKVRLTDMSPKGCRMEADSGDDDDDVEDLLII